MSRYTPLYILLPLLAADAAIEMGFIVGMVRFLHTRAGRSYTINGPDGEFEMHGKPAGIMVDQGHTSNGAAGTAIVLVGILGALAIWTQKRRERRNTSSRKSPLFLSWVVLTVLSALLTLAALIYTFVLTNQTDGQTIDIAIAAQNPQPAMYPLDDWTPETWFDAVLQLPLVHQSDRDDISHWLTIMRGWRWNLIPLLVLGVATASAAVWAAIASGPKTWRGPAAAEGKLRHSGTSNF